MLNKMNKGRFHIELWAYEQISRSVESGFEAWILDFSVHKLVRRLSLSIWHPIYLWTILSQTGGTLAKPWPDLSVVGLVHVGNEPQSLVI